MMRVDDAAGARRLAAWIRSHSPLLVLTGAGVSTASGIPDYRDRRGQWKRPRPVLFSSFVGEASVRRRYWARSFAGWPRFASARPGAAHRALAAWEGLGHVRLVVTQNVDRLHQAAGSRRVLDLHGRLDRVRCLRCRRAESRDAFQARLRDANPGFETRTVRTAPDGDAEIGAASTRAFQVPGCRHCGGVMKPDVVFFGEAIPAPRKARARRALSGAGGVLVVGSSLMVFSGYGLCLEARRRGLPIACVNLGATRADGALALKVEGRCERVLPAVTPLLASGDGPVRPLRGGDGQELFAPH